MEVKLYLSKKGIQKQNIFDVLIKYNINANIQEFFSSVHYKKDNKTKIEQGYSIHIFETNKAELLLLWHSLRKAVNIQCIYIESGKYNGCMAKLFKSSGVKCSQAV